MCALAPLNLLVVLGAHVPEAFGDLLPPEESKERQFVEVASDVGTSPSPGVDLTAKSTLQPLISPLAPPRRRWRGYRDGDAGEEAMPPLPTFTQGVASSQPRAGRAEGGCFQQGGSTCSTAPPSPSRPALLQRQPAAKPFPQVWPTDTVGLDAGSFPAEAFSEYVCEQMCFKWYPERRPPSSPWGTSRPSTSPAPEEASRLASSSEHDSAEGDGENLTSGEMPEHTGASDVVAQDADTRKRHFTLEMSPDNVAALAVITMLSFLGAIYLWKICTRKSCACRLCRNQYRTLNLLGSGGYGSVYLVERLGDGARFVSKKILVREITEVDEYSREAKDLVTLRHKHIVSYEDDFVHVEYGGLEPKTFFMIIMEYCPEGDLKEKIESDFLGFTESWVRTVFAQLLQAVQYLHSKNVIHRDLKSQNVFLMHDGLIRLGDFGLCRHTRNRALGSATLTHAGTDCYMAPEMLSSSKYGKPADMWSVGCVLYELCTGQFMWELDGILGAMVMKDSLAVAKLLQSNLVPAIGGPLASLMKRLLSVSPNGRPTATECIRKKIFKRGFVMSTQTFGQALGETEPGDEAEGSPGAVSDADDASSASGHASSDDNDDDNDATAGEAEAAPTPRTATTTPRKKPNTTPPMVGVSRRRPSKQKRVGKNRR